MDLGKASHCVYKIRYHMVLCVKYRKGLVRGDLETFLCEILKGIGDRYEFCLDAVGYDGNHVHVPGNWASFRIFIGAAPRNAPSRAMQVMCRCCDMPAGKRGVYANEAYHIYVVNTPQLAAGIFIFKT